ncbi:MAG TPA: hypothetical protein VFZ89_05745, partial [Solirubrobacteraceae bacterium]
AAAGHLQPSATATLVDEGVNGSERTVRVDVTGTCGPLAGPATMTLSVRMYGRYAKDRQPPYPLSAAIAVAPDDPDATLPGPSASFRYRVGNGVLATARATVDCTPPPPADGELPEDPRSATSPFSNAIRAPWKLGWSKPGQAFGGSPGRCTPPERRLQVGAGADFQWDLSGLDLRGALGRTRVSLESLREIDLHVSGGGRKARTFHPSRNGYRRFHGALLSGYYFIPRTTQPVKLWAQVGEAKSDVVTIRVRKRPRGCRNAF